MKDIFAINPGYIKTTAYQNDYYYQKYDSMLAKDSAGYYVYKKEVFYDRPELAETSAPVIGETQKKMLQEIKSIFGKNKTRFKLVVSPLYEQKKINGEDIKDLKNIFGENAIYDYSGKNEITATKTNYYESSHFKPYIAGKIMVDIYTK